MADFDDALARLAKESKELIEGALTTLISGGPAIVPRAVVAVGCRFTPTQKDSLIAVICFLDAVLLKVKSEPSLATTQSFVELFFLEDTTYVALAKLFVVCHSLPALQREKALRFVKRWGTQQLLPTEATAAMQRAVGEGKVPEAGPAAVQQHEASSPRKEAQGGMSTDDAAAITKLLEECTRFMSQLSRHEVRRLRDRLQLARLRQSDSPSDLIASLVSVREALVVAAEEHRAQQLAENQPAAADVAGLRAMLATVEQADDSDASDGEAMDDEKGTSLQHLTASLPAYRSPLESNPTSYLTPFGSAGGPYRHPRREVGQKRPFRMPLSVSRDRGGAHRCWHLTPDQWVLEGDMSAVKVAVTFAKTVLGTRESSAVGDTSRKRQRDVKQEESGFEL